MPLLIIAIFDGLSGIVHVAIYPKLQITGNRESDRFFKNDTC